MSLFKKRVKDFHRCLRSIGSFSDGQASVKSWDTENMSSLVVELRPNGGPYKGGKFTFEIRLPENYPRLVPEVVCTTPIYHPNIDNTSEEDNVCLNLFDEWQENFGLEDCIQGLLFLLHNPNLEDPLSPYFDPSMDEAEFEENVAASLKGEEIEGECYPENNVDAKDGDDENKAGDVSLILETVETMMTSLGVDDDDGSDAEQKKRENEDAIKMESAEDTQKSADQQRNEDDGDEDPRGFVELNNAVNMGDATIQGIEDNTKDRNPECVHLARSEEVQAVNKQSFGLPFVPFSNVFGLDPLLDGGLLLFEVLCREIS